MTYFDFLVSKIVKDWKQAERYMKLLCLLFDEPFVYTHPMDENRWEDGRSMRNSFIFRHGPNYEDAELFKTWSDIHQCSWLEVMVALAVRCEDIMCEPRKDTTSKWFWGMIDSMDLSDQINDRFDIHHVGEVLMTIYHRDYAPDGHGGLFYVKGTNLDMRQEEIWTQAMEYLNQFD